MNTQPFSHENLDRAEEPEPMAEPHIPEPAAPQFFELRIEVLDAPIPLWRRALVPPHVPLPLMSELLATLRGREDSIDQFRFVRGGVSWEIPWPLIETASLDAYHAVLADGLAEPGDVLRYEDDWGGLWWLDLHLDRMRTVADLLPDRVVVLDGAGAPRPARTGMAATCAEANRAVVFRSGHSWPGVARGGCHHLPDRGP